MQGRAEVADQHVLEHVHREQVVLADRVDGRDESGERDGEPGAKSATRSQPARSARPRRRSRSQPCAKSTSRERRGGERRAPGQTTRACAEHYSPRSFAITMRCTSFVPSPISRIFWSRNSREIAYSSMKP